MKNFKIICKVIYYDHLNFENSYLVWEKDSTIFYLKDDKEKIDDILKMPDYISLEWMRYNSSLMDLITIDKLISKVKSKEELEILKLIRRDIGINNILD